MGSMNYMNLQRDILVSLRGNKTQSELNEKLGFSFNKVYRWEKGRTHISWEEFVKLCAVLQVNLEPCLNECYSYYDDVCNPALLVQHFVGRNRQVDVAQHISTSRYTLSRWLSGSSSPTLDQMLSLMDYGSVDFLRFVEKLTHNSKLPSIEEKLREDHIQLKMFNKYPWMSSLLSAIDLDLYKKNPSDEFLSEKSKIPLSVMKDAIEDLSRSGLLEWNGKYWETRVKRISFRGSPESQKRMARYVYNTVIDGVEASFEKPQMKFSWKLFSMNQKSYEKMLHKYTEFFNELGTLIDASQEGADKIYLFSVGIVDYDYLTQPTDLTKIEKAPAG